jgi:hypothetical protein
MPAREPILAESVAPAPASAGDEPARTRTRRGSRKGGDARKAANDRPVWTIPAAPVARPPSPVLAPDEDATLPPSDL